VSILFGYLCVIQSYPNTIYTNIKHASYGNYVEAMDVLLAAKGHFPTKTQKCLPWVQCIGQVLQKRAIYRYASFFDKIDSYPCLIADSLIL
jgi:hypothetical protein